MRVEKLYNVSIGTFKLPTIDLFQLDDDGQYRPTVRSLQCILDIIAPIGSYTIKVAEKDQFGQLNGSDYDTGVLGMMQRKEVDFCLFPIPIDIPEPPGLLTTLISEEKYIIRSFPQEKKSIQDVTRTLKMIDYWAIIVIMFLILILEALLALKRYRQLGSFNWPVKALWKALELSPSTLLGQYFPDRYMIRFICGLGIFLLTCIISASFATDAIASIQEKLPENLKDIVTLKLRPHFFQGESVFELFQQGISSEYRNVYILAKEKSTNIPYKLGGLQSLSASTPGNAILSSVRIARASTVLGYVLNNPNALTAYYSKPYHVSLLAFLVRPISKHFVKVCNTMATRSFEVGITKKLLPRVFDEVLIKAGFGITQYNFDKVDSQINKRRNDLFVRPLSLSAFHGILSIWLIFLGFATIEMIFSIFYNICYRKALRDSSINK